MSIALQLLQGDYQFQRLCRCDTDTHFTPSPGNLTSKIGTLSVHVLIYVLKGVYSVLLAFSVFIIELWFFSSENGSR